MSTARSRLLCAGVAALTLHVALWAGLQAGRGEWVPPGIGSRAAEEASHRSVQVRLTQPNDRTRALAPTSAPDTWVTAEVESEAPATEPAAETTTTATTHTGDPDVYLSRDAVDSGPQPVGLIQIPYPEGVTADPGDQAGQAHTGRLTLYIDENGSVRRVQVHGDQLPIPFQEAARNAFLQARFVPGQRMGQPVKVRIDIEVSFDDRELAPAAARAVPRSSA